MRRSMALPAALLLLVSMAVGPSAMGGSPAPGAPPVTWRKQAPLPTYHHLYGLDMINATEGWAVGGEYPSGPASILHTTDGGVTWERQENGATEALHGVRFLDADHGWAVGNVMLWTDDGGETWNESEDRVGSAYGVDFLDVNRGWAVSNGGIVSRTVDGGRNWTWVPTSTTETLKDVDFVNGTTGWIVGVNGTILRSTDGGQTWTEQPADATYLDGVDFVSAQEGWVAGGNTILHTTNAGATWQRQSAPPGAWAHGLSFADPMHGWIAGENVAATSDGGRTWTMQQIDNPNRLWAVDGVSASTAVIVGERAGLYTTSDGGGTWVTRLNGSPAATFGIDANDPQHAWAVGDFGETQYTVDGGYTWKRVPVGDPFGAFHAVDFLPNNTRGWLAGGDRFATGEIYRSDNGGATWTKQFTGGENTQLLGVAAIDQQTAVAAGSAYIWRTSDGGQNWTAVPHPPGGAWTDLEFKGRTGFVAGSNGFVLRSDDGGATWADVSPSIVGDPPFLGVSFADPNNGWAVGFFGTVARTTDGGQTWTQIHIPGLEDATFTSVSAVGAKTAWLSPTLAYSAVYRTTDGGATWTRERLPGSEGYVRDVAFLSPNTGWAGAWVGVWLRYGVGRLTAA